jgi:hypothetical protein
MLWRSRTRPAFPRFVQPCQPMPAPRPPRGGDWLHEIKHDGCRMIARRDGARVQSARFCIRQRDLGYSPCSRASMSQRNLYAKRRRFNLPPKIPGSFVTDFFEADFEGLVTCERRLPIGSE